MNRKEAEQLKELNRVKEFARNSRVREQEIEAIREARDEARAEALKEKKAQKEIQQFGKFGASEIAKAFSSLGQAAGAAAAGIQSLADNAIITCLHLEENNLEEGKHKQRIIKLRLKLEKELKEQAQKEQLEKLETVKAFDEAKQALDMADRAIRNSRLKRLTLDAHGNPKMMAKSEALNSLALTCSPLFFLSLS